MEGRARLITNISASANRNAPPLLAAIGGVLATILTSASCIVPLLAISLGSGGFGWLTSFSGYRVPFTITTFALLACGFYWTHRRSARAKKNPCSVRRTRIALWLALGFAVCINAFEYFLYAYFI